MALQCAQVAGHEAAELRPVLSQRPRTCNGVQKQHCYTAAHVHGLKYTRRAHRGLHAQSRQPFLQLAEVQAQACSSPSDVASPPSPAGQDVHVHFTASPEASMSPTGRDAPPKQQSRAAQHNQHKGTTANTPCGGGRHHEHLHAPHVPTKTRLTARSWQRHAGHVGAGSALQN